MSEGMNLETMERIKALKGEVIAQLQRASAAQLTEICVEISVVIPPRKAGIKSALANLVVLFLSSPAIEESDDYGEQMIMDLKQKLDQRLGPTVVEVSVSGDVKVDPEVKGKATFQRANPAYRSSKQQQCNLAKRDHSDVSAKCTSSRWGST